VWGPAENPFSGGEGVFTAGLCIGRQICSAAQIGL